MNARAETQILVALRRIMRATDLHSKQLSRSHGLTSPQLIVLNELHRQDGRMAIGAIAKAVSLSQPTITGIVSRLERMNLAHRTRSDEDRRSVVVVLTDLGRDVVRSAPPLLQDRFVANLRAAAPWERTQILATLQRVVAMMEADHVEATPVLLPGGLEDGNASSLNESESQVSSP